MDPNHELKKEINNVKRAAALILAAVMLASCSAQPETSEETTSETTVWTEVSVETTEIETPGSEFPPITYIYSMPDIEKTESLTKSMVFYRDGKPIYGKITLPKGKGPFKTIIISNGLYAPLGRYSNKALSYSEKGYAVVEFQYQNGEPPESYDDPEFLGDFIYEQVKDLFAVMDSMSYLPYVDTSNLYLYGHSMGGLVTSYAGAMRQDKVKGLILVDPSFYATDLMSFENDPTITTDIYPLLKECNIPAVIITGTAGSFGEDPHAFDDAMKAFPRCELIRIEGATHTMEGAASEQVVVLSVEAMKKWG